jgi:UDP-N-acetylmuramyl tripeptide synthase
MSLKSEIKNLVGQQNINKVAPYYHGLRGIISAWRYGNPASKLFVIGVTGTKGKTTTTMQLGRMLNLSGIKTGYISTASVNLGDQSSNQILRLEKLKKSFSIEKLKSLKSKVESE